MKPVSVLMGVAVLLTCAPQVAVVVAGDKEALEKVEYFPLKVGTTWEYLASGKKIVTKVAAHEKLGDQLCARLETTMDGVTLAEYLTVITNEKRLGSGAGLYRLVANNQEVWLVLKTPSKVGDKWDVALRNLPLQGSLGILEAKQLKVGNQEYDTIVVISSNLKFAGQDVEMKTWYAKDVGMVKQSIVQPATGLVIDLELEKFTPVQ
jgi:hypothetical protein